MSKDGLAWLEECEYVGFLEGYKLVKELATPKKGEPRLTDSVARADTLLKRWETEGRIRRCTVCLSREQAFFRSDDCLYPSMFGWEPVRMVKLAALPRWDKKIQRWVVD